MYTSTLKRVNISIPESTLEKIDALTERGDRSKFIDTAVHFYVDAVGNKNLKKALKEGAVRHAVRDTDITTQWFQVDESVWLDKK